MYGEEDGGKEAHNISAFCYQQRESKVDTMESFLTCELDIWDL
jgi:hypothetical protein